MWEGTGNFDGSFTVSADGTKITNLSGSFETDLFGEIDVPGDLDPPAETAISNNEFSMLMNKSGTLDILRAVQGPSLQTQRWREIMAGVSMDVDLAARISIDAEYQGGDPIPTTEPPPTTRASAYNNRTTTYN